MPIEPKQEYINLPLNLNYPDTFNIIDALILARIWSFQSNDKTYYESQASLAEKLLVSRSAVNRRIKGLLKSGWVINLDSKNGDSLHLRIPSERVNYLYQNATGGCSKMLQGVSQNATGGCSKMLHKNKDYNKTYNKEDNTSAIASVNATPNGSASSLKAKKEKKTSSTLTRDDVQSHYQNHIYLKAILDYFDFRDQLKKPVKTITQIDLNIEQYGSQFEEVVKQSIRNGWQGLFSLKAEQKDSGSLKEKATALFHDLFHSKDDEQRFFDICKKSDIKEILKKYMFDRNLKTPSQFIDYFLECENQYVFNTKLKDFTAKMPLLAAQTQKGD